MRPPARGRASDRQTEAIRNYCRRSTCLTGGCARQLSGLDGRIRGNDLRDIRIGMAAAELRESGYVDFACAADPKHALAGWTTGVTVPPM